MRASFLGPRGAGRLIDEHVFLRAGVLLTLQGVPGLLLQPGRGQLWITRYGDTCDHFAMPGKPYRIGDGGSYCVASFAPTLVKLVGHVHTRLGWAIERSDGDGARQRIAPRSPWARARNALADWGAALGDLEPRLRRLQ